jgi:hypothetical protein
MGQQPTSPLKVEESWPLNVGSDFHSKFLTDHAGESSSDRRRGQERARDSDIDAGAMSEPSEQHAATA